MELIEPRALASKLFQLETLMVKTCFARMKNANTVYTRRTATQPVMDTRDMEAGRHNTRKVVMLGPSVDGQGGVSTVIGVYRAGGLFERSPIVYLVTHSDGSAARKIFVAISALFRFLWIVAHGKRGILHAHTSERSSFWRKSIFILVAKMFGWRIICHLHAPEFGDFYFDEIGPLRKWLVRLVLKESDVVIALAHQWELVLQRICPAAKIHVVFNPIGPPAKSKEPAGKDENCILFLGRMGARKGVFDLVDAMTLVHREFPSAKAVCAGDGEVDKVVERVQGAGLADVIQIRGWVRGLEKLALLERAWIYALPSYNEGLPMSILEAMSYGIPVVTSPVGGIPDAVEDGKQGFLVDPGDVTGLAVAISSLLRDKNLRESMGAAAKERIGREFSAEVVIPRIETLYQTLSEQSPSL